jgi:MFS family permease
VGLALVTRDRRSAAAGLSIAQRHIWRSYLIINAIFAAVNGLYTAYAFLYLKHALNRAGGVSASILDNLLFILVASMAFEFFAEPITGDWADTYGRRRVISATFLGLSLAFLTYWGISAEAIGQLREPQRVIVVLSLIAELFFAISSALFNGALDAWFVDELRLAGGPSGAALLPLFATQRRWSGAFMVAGGVLSLWIASAVFRDHPSAGPGGLATITALPWLVAVAITVPTALWVKLRVVEHRALVVSHEPAHWRIWLRLRRTLRQRELRNALLVSSVLYTCWICFAYLLPVLLTEPRIVADAGLLRGVLQNYYWYYLAMGTSRFVGPYLSSAIGPAASQILRFRWWGLLNCGALLAAGLAVLVRGLGLGGAGDTAASALIPLALVLFWVAKVSEEAFKPVRSTYLNHLVIDSSDRAFVLSMATPFGAVIILLGAGALAAAQHFLQFLSETRVSVPLLFAILGTLGVAVTLQLSRRSLRQFQ